MNNNKQIYAGVDEAGRGPWAGPVVSSAVILININNITLDKLADSKKIPEKKRIKIYEELLVCAQNQEIYYGVGLASVEEIDKLNILQATLLSMKRAVINCYSNYQKPFYLQIDGNQLPRWQSAELINFPNDFCEKNQAIVNGDALIPCISAASIIAKTHRDKIMVEFDNIYPNYGFAKHKGYGTSTHLSALQKFGVCPIHRKSYKPIAKIINQIRL